ncbi:MAG: hypothetical protein RIC04_03500 [Parvibaculum sp.]|uniref:hypothetical protein n=1 Tax=Parvibaculum sp. TaxID=2024848 RepID=UPI0032EC2604
MIRQTIQILVLSLLAAAPAAAQSAKFEPGTRTGPFVATDKSLTDLVGDGYRIRGNLGTALILQKGASVFSCQVPPDPEALGFKPYFVCAELSELPRAPEEEALEPRTGN